MSIDTNDPQLAERARLHAALGDPIRLAVAECLLLGDRSPASLSAQWGVASNLLAHHVSLLVAAGAVVRLPSQGDRRRVYLRLTAAGRAVLGPSSRALSTPRVVFVCTHNSARSQFAEALWRDRSRVPVSSVGTHPARRVHPMACRVARRQGVGLAGARPTPLTEGALSGALVVTVCDSADAELTPTRVQHLHWSVPDPVAIGGEPAFLRAWAEIAERIDVLVAAAKPTGWTDEATAPGGSLE